MKTLDKVMNALFVARDGGPKWLNVFFVPIAITIICLVKLATGKP